MSPTFRHVSSAVRDEALRTRGLSLGKSRSMGLKSGLKGGSTMRCAPTARMACRASVPLWGAEIVEDDDVTGHSVAAPEYPVRLQN